MGEKSFGKGSVQTILPTSNGAAIKLTTARYFTPSGRSIQAEGIEPDVKLARVKLESLDKAKFDSIKESDLSHHLSNPTGKPKDVKEPEEDKADDKDNVEGDEKAADDNKNLRDYPLSEALNLLKGIGIFRK